MTIREINLRLDSDAPKAARQARDIPALRDRRDIAAVRSGLPSRKCAGISRQSRETRRYAAGLLTAAFFPSRGDKSMTEIIAYCGLACHTCPIYLATRQENKEVQTRMRMEIVHLCKEHYGIQYRLEDITDCDGCRTDGDRLFSASRNCPIRTCAREMKLENCAHCPEYFCGKLETFFRTEIAAKTRLDAIRRNIQ